MTTVSNSSYVHIATGNLEFSLIADSDASTIIVQDTNKQEFFPKKYILKTEFNGYDDYLK